MKGGVAGSVQAGQGGGGRRGVERGVRGEVRCEGEQEAERDGRPTAHLKQGKKASSPEWPRKILRGFIRCPFLEPFPIEH